MQILKLNSQLQLFSTTYVVKSISKKGVLFTLSDYKADSAKELFLTLEEVESLLFAK